MCGGGQQAPAREPSHTCSLEAGVSQVTHRLIRNAGLELKQRWGVRVSMRVENGRIDQLELPRLLYGHGGGVLNAGEMGRGGGGCSSGQHAGGG